MKFSLVAFLAAAASSVVAQTPGFDVLTNPTDKEVLEAGSPYTIKWKPNGVKGLVTLEVLEGTSAATLGVREILSTTIDNTVGFYKWTVPATNLKAAYGLRISLTEDKDTFQWSFPFTIEEAAAPNPPKDTSSKTSSTIKSRTTYTTISLAPGPAYSVVPTTYPAVPTTTAVPVYNVTLPSSYSSSNVTYVNPTSSKISAAPTYPVEPTGPAPTGGEAPPQTTPDIPISGAASVGISGLALVGGLVLAFAL